MTQAAVSYQIKVLEDRVGGALFLRHPRGVELTSLGRRFAHPTTDALDQLRNIYKDVRDEAHDMLRISVAPTFAANVLAPRLGHFQISNPSIGIRIDMNQALVDFERDEIDIAIRSGKGDWPGLECHLLLRTEATPMLTPELAESIGWVRKPTDLLKLPLIEPMSPWWRKWFGMAGVEFAEIPDQPHLNFGAQVLEAAATLAGQGVGKLEPTLYRDALEQGRLLQPFELTCDDDNAIWLVYPENRRKVHKIGVFRDWLTEIMAKGL